MGEGRHTYESVSGPGESRGVQSDGWVRRKMAAGMRQGNQGHRCSGAAMSGNNGGQYWQEGTSMESSITGIVGSDV